MGPGTLVFVIPVKIGQGIFCPHTAVLLVGGTVALILLRTTGSIRRICDQGIKNSRTERLYKLQRISMQDTPPVTADRLHRECPFFHQVIKLQVILHRHHPFLYRSLSSLLFFPFRYSSGGSSFRCFTSTSRFPSSRMNISSVRFK